MKIIASGEIRQSEVKHGDAVMGNGTYLTQLDPSISKQEVAKNNYDGDTNYWKSQIKADKTEAVIEVKFRKDEVQNYSSELQRDVHVHPGSISMEKVKDPMLHIKTGDKTYITATEIPIQ
jgi:hypothetical protein